MPLFSPLAFVKCVHVYAYTYLFLNIACSGCMMSFVCMRLRAGHLIPDNQWLCSSLGKLFLPLSALIGCLSFLCRVEASGSLAWLDEQSSHQCCSVTSPETYECDLCEIYWCDSSANALGVTNHFLIAFKISSIRGNPYLTLIKWPRTWDYIGHVSSGKTYYSIILLRGYSDEVSPDGVML